MRSVKILCASVVVTAKAVSGPAEACTTFASGGPQGITVGKSFDWQSGRGLVVANKRGMRKSSLPDRVGGSRFPWVSRYGSLSLNWVGTEFPASGRNEAGLTVEALMVMGNARGGTLFPKASRTLTALQWAQYQLDTANSLADVERSLEDLSYWQLGTPIHFFLCEAQGACAVVEESSSGMHLHRVARPALRVLENAPYALSVDRYTGAPNSAGSRFATIARVLEPGSDALLSSAATFNLLNTVRLGALTQWQLVWEGNPGVLHYRQPNISTEIVRSLAFSSLNFSCSEPTQLATVDVRQGDPALEDFQPEKNAAVLQAALTDMRLLETPHGETSLFQAVLAASQSATCQP